jgi:hypothetical protein
MPGRLRLGDSGALQPVRSMNRKSKTCALCKKSRVRSNRAALPAALHAALLSCCHLWIPAVNDPICTSCKNFYREHIREHDGSIFSTNHV